MDLQRLKDVMPHKWRVQAFSKHKPKATCVAYIDARQAMDKLDQVVGPENWQDKYEIVDDTLFCSVGIKCDGEWVWKTDCGVESNVEKEKGQASDAFKRACVKWGIGRFLYEMDMFYVDANEKKTNSNFPYPIDKQGNRIWDLTAYVNRENPKVKKVAQQSPATPAREQKPQPQGEPDNKIAEGFYDALLDAKSEAMVATTTQAIKLAVESGKIGSEKRETLIKVRKVMLDALKVLSGHPEEEFLLGATKELILKKPVDIDSMSDIAKEAFEKICDSILKSGLLDE